MQKLNLMELTFRYRNKNNICKCKVWLFINLCNYLCRLKYEVIFIGKPGIIINGLGKNSD